VVGTAPLDPAGCCLIGCGDGICSPEIGESCQNCAEDCRAKFDGAKRNRYCCGSDVDCSDSRCSSSNGRWKCGDVGGSICNLDSLLGGQATPSPPSPPACKSKKEPCPNGNDECCSGRCNAKTGTCARARTPTCKTFRQPCTENGECCGGNCRANKGTCGN
jgi:hypothetical protein